MANPFVVRCSKVPDETMFYVDATYGSDVPENGYGRNENAWATIDYAIGQINSYGAAFGACNAVISVRNQNATVPANYQTLRTNVRAKRIRFVSGGFSDGNKTRLIIDNENPSLFLDCVFQGFMICSDMNTLGGLITFEKCEFTVTQNVHNCDFRLVDVEGGNVFNISEGYALSVSDSTIRDDNTIYNWTNLDNYPTGPPVRNYANAFYVCQFRQTGSWLTTYEMEGCTEGTMSIGYYRQSGATYSASPGKILGFTDDKPTTPVPIDYLENQKMEVLNLQDYCPTQDKMDVAIYRIGRFVFTTGGFSEFGNPVPAGHASTGSIPLPERFRPPQTIKLPHVRGDNNRMTGLYTLFGSNGFITLATFNAIDDTSGWNQPPLSWIVDNSVV
jgi:hypothetical protein